MHWQVDSHLLCHQGSPDACLKERPFLIHAAPSGSPLITLLKKKKKRIETYIKIPKFILKTSPLKKKLLLKNFFFPFKHYLSCKLKRAASISLAPTQLAFLPPPPLQKAPLKSGMTSQLPSPAGISLPLLPSTLRSPRPSQQPRNPWKAASTPTFLFLFLCLNA